MRVSLRLGVTDCSASNTAGRMLAILFSAADTYVCSRSMPMKCRPSLRATAPVVPVPKKGSSTMSPGLVVALRMRNSSASGFWVGWTFSSSSSFRRSAPVQIGKSQSERVCVSSLASFIAS